MQKSKKLFSVFLAMLMVFSISGASGLNAAAANSVSKTYSVKALVNSYTAKLSAKITSSKLTASTYYEGKAKELVTIGFAIRSDTDANGNYRFDSEESTLTNVTGKTASLSISAGSKKYIKSVTEHYIKTSAEESSKTYTLTV